MSLIELEGMLYWDDKKLSADVIPKFELGASSTIYDGTLLDQLDALAIGRRGDLPTVRVIVDEATESASTGVRSHNEEILRMAALAAVSALTKYPLIAGSHTGKAVVELLSDALRDTE